MWWTPTAPLAGSSRSVWGGSRRRRYRSRSTATRWSARSSCRGRRGVIPPSSIRLSRFGRGGGLDREPGSVPSGKIKFGAVFCLSRLHCFCVFGAVFVRHDYHFCMRHAAPAFRRSEGGKITSDICSYLRLAGFRMHVFFLLPPPRSSDFCNTQRIKAFAVLARTRTTPPRATTTPCRTT